MPGTHKKSENTRIDLLIQSILEKLCPFLEEQAEQISELTALGKALGSDKDIRVLLEMILSIAGRFTRADGGTLYLVDHARQSLVFTVIQNKSLGLTDNKRNIDLPGVPLYHRDGSPNYSNVSAHVFHTGKIVNIKDVYRTKKFQFEGTRKFDKTLHYRSQSMVVIPMTNHENEIIGILQLINSIDPFTGKTTPFTREDQEKAAALASQASVILTQQSLIFEMETLFESFITAIAVSIDEKSKHTGGHIQRVTELSLMIAGKINQDQILFQGICLTDEQMDELRIAALMHDTGKITTPEHIIGKSSRLETVYDRIDLLRTRWELFKAHQKLDAAQKKLALLDQTHRQNTFRNIDAACDEQLIILENEFKTLAAINSCKKCLDPGSIARLEAIKEKQLKIFGRNVPYLSKDEFENLCILRGTLSSKERDVINNHAVLTRKILSKLPWPKKLVNIPSIAGAHHEKLDGSGYPLHLDRENLNIQARILAIADIFEALSARDRPYKDPMTLSRAVQILEEMGKKGLVDNNIVDLFFSSGIHLEYAKKHLSSSQIDL
jgi:HD-GYP domain-containing protein (c-di-GMP phosphodiesterase class II)